MQKNMQFSVNISDFDAAAWKRLQEAHSQLESAKKEIIDAFSKSERAKAAYDLSGFGSLGSKYSPVHRIDGPRILTSITVEIEEPPGKKACHPTLNLGEKTINALLNGRLLDDDQKKALLKQLGVDLESLNETAGA
ncbi:hypothetical protein [Rhizobium rhizogenes]|uniref:hypothetical protein n=1 Tax=Rhizobium rhizogenes TaxID=359 RepID=UPI0022CCF1AA|nr:hypothetical protein [Rhizobium rhizogenes]MCZ7488215.1 hypothetical protein [Rhizobium rhizogenes]